MLVRIDRIWLDYPEHYYLRLLARISSIPLQQAHSLQPGIAFLRSSGNASPQALQ